MNQEIKSLIEAKKQWESDIEMYKDFLKGETQTYEGKYGAEEYILMAKNRLDDINQKLKKIEDQS
tara:strand:- start:1495 stop:1689 length:195 start_codon:yes stop_codon:yes gene_type:complete